MEGYTYNPLFVYILRKEPAQIVQWPTRKTPGLPILANAPSAPQISLPNRSLSAAWEAWQQTHWSQMPKTTHKRRNHLMSPQGNLIQLSTNSDACDINPSGNRSNPCLTQGESKWALERLLWRKKFHFCFAEQIPILGYIHSPDLSFCFARKSSVRFKTSGI